MLLALLWVKNDTYSYHMYDYYYASKNSYRRSSMYGATLAVVFKSSIKLLPAL
jgi:hypothetical protein